jgi:exosortase/archaeosortase family protein
MRPGAWRVLARVGWRLLVTVGTFVALIQPVRRAEAAAAAGLLHLLGAEGVTVQLGTSIQVFPPEHAAFRASVTPSCSCLAALLAIGYVAGFLPRGPRKRRFSVVLVALVAVAAGNVLRIAASLGVGLVAGRVSLILLHDWVGSVFTFAYTLGGYLLMLYLLLPARAEQPAPVRTLYHAT